MKVIFVKDLKKQGKKGDIKEVKDGYAQNFLIKNGFAVQVTGKSLEKVEEENQKLKEKDDQLRLEAIDLKTKIEKLMLVFKVKTGDHDKVFGSISPKQIKEELLKKGFKVDKKQIDLEFPLSSLGVHKVIIHIYKDIEISLRVQLVK